MDEPQNSASGGYPEADDLIPVVYDELKQLARGMLSHERVSHTLQPTALVNEVYLKLAAQDRTQWQSKQHFIAIGAQAMRRVLMDYARTKKRVKRGGNFHRVELHEDMATADRRDLDILDLDEALTRLADLDERQAQVVELRFFGGLSNREVAEVLGVSERTVANDWRVSKAWLARELDQPAR